MAQELLSWDWDTTNYDIATVSETRSLRPEERLFLAVIMQAVEDATSPKPSVQRDQARSVIFAASATPIKDMCLILNIDPDYLARGVKKMIEEGRTLRREV